ncbi:MAG: DUF1572 family protein [Planctomycetes bacterium]|nr:DUF1572 family protein [Planctomycetota bacterium]
MADITLAASFTEYAARKMEDHHAQIARCAGLLSDEYLWFRPNERSNSVANLLLHLRGNISQWVLTGLAGQMFHRERQAEFDARGPMPRERVVGPLAEAVEAVCGVIRGLDAAELARVRTIQAYRVTGIAAVMHVVEHFAFHTGQIVTTTKWLLNVDLSLYDENGHRRDGRTDDVP